MPPGGRKPALPSPQFNPPMQSALKTGSGIWGESEEASFYNHHSRDYGKITGPPCSTAGTS